MGFPWTRVLSVGSGLAGIFVPALDTAITTVEHAAGTAPGATKQATAIAIASAAVDALEGALGRTVLTDAQVVQATRQFVDAVVAVKNAEGAVVLAETTLRQVIADAEARAAAPPGSPLPPPPLSTLGG